MNDPYLFTSPRLGFRPWTLDDLDVLHALCSHPKVMRYFPAVLNREETTDLLDRFIRHYEQRGYTYFATELRDDRTVIGFIGLAYQTYPAKFTPATDTGWRLFPTHWGRGYATEGARRCLAYARELGLPEIVAIASRVNAPSIAVMERAGMTYRGEFTHPALPATSPLQPCVYYATQP